ncbi:hypothetical protein EDB86DRAFT_2829028 [Lactarius hatsudake]|nr:hypothetical protein EDB86DRAFT_2829028 [Lactarius hatsudake]
MWASNRCGMGVGVNAFCGLNSISTPPFPTLRRRVTMRHPSAGARREYGTPSSTRPQPWVMYGTVGAWPLSTSKSNTYYPVPFGRCEANPSPVNQICTQLSWSRSRAMYSYRSSASPNEDTGVSRLLNFKFRKEMTLIPRMCQSTRSPPQESTTIRRSRDRMAGSFLPNARPLAHYAGDTLCRSCEMMAQEAYKRKAEGNPTLTMAIMETCSPWQRSRTYEGAVTLAQRTQIGHFYPSSQACIRFFVAQDISADIGLVRTRSLPDLNVRSAGAHPRRVTRIRKTRRRRLSPDSLPHARCHIHRVGTGICQERQDEVIALHPHAAQDHHRACRQLDAHDDPAGPGGMRAEMEGKQFDLVLRENAHAWLKHHDTKAT